MAIDYDSGSGLFDKLGPVVSMVNAIEAWQTTNSSGNLEGNMTTLEAVFEDSKVYDRIAKNSMLSKWASYNAALDSMKLRYTELTRLLMASEMVLAESLTTDSLPGLLAYLVERMTAVDNESVKRSARTTAANPSYLLSITGSVYGVFSVKGPGIQGAGASLTENGKVPHDTLHVKVSEVTTYLQEKVDVYGTAKPASAAHPQRAYAGTLASKFQLTRFKETRNLITDPNFEATNAQSNLKHWLTTTGTWGTDLDQSYANPVFDGPKSLLFLGNGKVVQDIPPSKFKPNTLYLAICAYDVSDVNPSDGNLNFGFLDYPAWYTTAAISFAVATGASFLVMTTGDYIPDVMTFGISRTSSANGQVRVNNIGLYEMKNTGDMWWLVGLAPRTSATGLSTPRILWEDQTIAITNDHAGLFQDYFLRFLNTQLPTSGSPSISDALAS